MTRLGSIMKFSQFRQRLVIYYLLHANCCCGACRVLCQLFIRRYKSCCRLLYDFYVDLFTQVLSFMRACSLLFFHSFIGAHDEIAFQKWCFDESAFLLFARLYGSLDWNRSSAVCTSNSKWVSWVWKNHRIPPDVVTLWMPNNWRERVEHQKMTSVSSIRKVVWMHKICASRDWFYFSYSTFRICRNIIHHRCFRCHNNRLDETTSKRIKEIRAAALFLNVVCKLWGQTAL